MFHFYRQHPYERVDVLACVSGLGGQGLGFTRVILPAGDDSRLPYRSVDTAAEADHARLRKVRETIRVGFPIITGIGREICDTGDHFVVIYGVGWSPSRVFICNQLRFGRSGRSRQ